MDDKNALVKVGDVPVIRDTPRKREWTHPHQV
jgi:hypothetical protein